MALPSRSVLTDALKAIRPKGTYVFDDSAEYGIVWTDLSVPAPSKEEMVAAINDAQNIYKQLRKEEYPSIADQLDAIWSGGPAQAAMLATIQGIKGKYPKPS